MQTLRTVVYESPSAAPDLAEHPVPVTHSASPTTKEDAPVFRTLAIVAAIMLTLTLSSVARAGDVKLLKQPSAFPLVISVPGSYRLKSNITVPDANTTAISCTVDNVTLDLNGYAITGPTVCSGIPVTSCSPTGTGNGIDATAHKNITVVNGTVQGLGGTGLVLGERAHVEKVRAVSNGSDGIDVQGASTLTGNAATENGVTGLFASDGAVVSGNTSRSNGFDGIFVSNGSTVLGNSAMFNGGYGLQGDGDFGYANNVFRTNTFGSVGGFGTDMGHNDCNGSTTCP